jgi:hypothetical protein
MPYAFAQLILRASCGPAGDSMRTYLTHFSIPRIHAKVYHPNGTNGSKRTNDRHAPCPCPHRARGLARGRRGEPLLQRRKLGRPRELPCWSVRRDDNDGQGDLPEVRSGEGAARQWFGTHSCFCDFALLRANYWGDRGRVYHPTRSAHPSHVPCWIRVSRGGGASYCVRRTG